MEIKWEIKCDFPGLNKNEKWYEVEVEINEKFYISTKYPKETIEEIKTKIEKIIDEYRI